MSDISCLYLKNVNWKVYVVRTGRRAVAIVDSFLRLVIDENPIFFSVAFSFFVLVYVQLYYLLYYAKCVVCCCCCC